MGRATSGVSGMKFRSGDSLLSMSVIRAEQVAAEEAAEAAAQAAGASTSPGDLPDVVEQYVFTITDGGFAKRTRISDYRLQSRGGIGIKAMSLANEDRGVLVGAFIVVEGDEILAITQTGQVVRSPINEHFRATGRSTMGVKFVAPKSGDAVAVVARSVESKEEDELVAEAGEVGAQVGAQVVAGTEAGVVVDAAAESEDAAAGATIDETDTTRPDSIGESEA
jgi:DNA gyrase subunit A